MLFSLDGNGLVGGVNVYRVDLENYENLFAGYWENRCGLYSGGN